MAKTKISEFSATPANNTDIDSINIAEGCAPSGINDAIRELMAQLKDFQTGAVGDSFNGPIGATTAGTGAFTTLSASSTTTLSGLTASTALALDASKNVVSVTNTGTGNNVLATSPTLVTPILGTPTSGTLTNATGLPIATGVSGLGSGVATFLATPSSANLLGALTDETGTGSAVFATSPTLVTPTLGVATATSLQGIIGNVTPAAGSFTTVTASTAIGTASGGTGLGGATPFTANGVVFASSASVLATGSALSFDGTNFFGGTNTFVTGRFYAQRSSSSLNLPIAGYTDGSAGAILTGARGDIVGFGNAGGDGVIFANNNTEQMRLTSTGLGIGTSSPSQKLDVSGNINVSGTGTSNFTSTATSPVQINGTSIPTLTINNSTTPVETQIRSTTTEGFIRTATNHPLLFGTNATEKMRITAAGNVGIGNIAPTGNLHIGDGTTIGEQNLYIQSDAANRPYLRLYGGTTNKLEIHIGSTANITTVSATDLVFSTNNTERARILSGGNFLIGATSTGNDEKLGVYQTSTSAGLFINPSNAAYNGTAFYINTTRAASNAFDFIGCYGNNVGQFRVVGDGVIYAQNTSVQSISDQRLKENIRDSSDGLAIVNALRPVRYDWKAGYGNTQKNQLGFIAQEIETVFPEAVSEWQVNKDDETVYKTVGPGALIPVLVKAIQEQQAIIQSLKARLDAANL